MNIIPSLRGFTFYLSIDSRFPFNVVIEMRKLGMSGYFYYMQEIWKPVLGYEGLYEVSNLGRILSLRFGKEKILKLQVQNGYRSKTVLNNGSCKNYLVSRLVAIAFIPNPDNLPLVCHIREDLDENGIIYDGADNLYWGTYSDNSKDMFNKGRSNNHLQLRHPMKGKFGKDNNKSKPLYQLTLDGTFIKKWDSIMDIKRELGINNISDCCLGKKKTAGGFIWRFE